VQAVAEVQLIQLEEQGVQAVGEAAKLQKKAGYS
jgi:hypothetical protein